MTAPAAPAQDSSRVAEALGAALLPWVLTLIAIGPFTGKLTERIPAGFLVAVGLTVMATGLVLPTGIDERSPFTDLRQPEKSARERA